MKCPRCADRDVRRSYRRPLEKLLFAGLALSPFRCRRCRNRFWRLEPPLFTLPRAAFLGLLLLVGCLWLVRSVDWMGSAEASPSQAPAESVRTEEVPQKEEGIAELPAGVSTRGSVAVVASGDEDRFEESTPRTPEPFRDFPTEPVPPSLEPVSKPIPEVSPRPVPGAGTSPSVPSTLLDGTGSGVAPGAEEAVPAASQVKRLRVVARPAWLDIEVVTGYPVQNYRSFADSPGRRIVVDLPGSWSQRLPADLLLEHHLVSAVDLRRFENRLRIQVDLLVDGLPVPVVEPRAYGLLIRILPVPLQPLGL